ncbi:NAD(P)H-hydrate dehydratase [Lysobacter korlensis]|uniref:ADP-dependent (S)-NAD(P)H-hydrate dehydratase n=1 Tax=Lysobacter korlensis TaxID=553636 RepID=A0ABV6RVS7_9GAMM
MTDFFRAEEAAELIAVPDEGDDKYSRGVLGVMTGSAQYPGAAVLGVEAALRTGVGMVRYVGPESAKQLVLARRPEAVSGRGRVQAWLVGSGMDAESRTGDETALLRDALREDLPAVIDAGALDLVGDAAGPVVITPHYGELARLLGAERADIAADPARFASRAAEQLGVTVLLKGFVTHVAGDGVLLKARSATPWLATAGSGDALGGVLGALLATHSDQILADRAVLPRLAAAAAVIHGIAGDRASNGGPVTVLDLAAALPATIAHLLGTRA